MDMAGYGPGLRFPRLKKIRRKRKQKEQVEQEVPEKK